MKNDTSGFIVLAAERIHNIVELVLVKVLKVVDLLEDFSQKELLAVAVFEGVLLEMPSDLRIFLL